MEDSDLARGEQERWDLDAINPSLVLGPGVGPQRSSESYYRVTQMGDGTFRTGIPRWGMGVVDVRDVAVAHYRAGFTPEARGRYIVSGHDSDFAEIAAILRDHFGDTYPFPRRTMPK